MKRKRTWWKKWRNDKRGRREIFFFNHVILWLSDLNPVPLQPSFSFFFSDRAGQLAAVTQWVKLVDPSSLPHPPSLSSIQITNHLWSENHLQNPTHTPIPILSMSPSLIHLPIKSLAPRNPSPFFHPAGSFSSLIPWTKTPPSNNRKRQLRFTIP